MPTVCQSQSRVLGIRSERNKSAPLGREASKSFNISCDEGFEEDSSERNLERKAESDFSGEAAFKPRSEESTEGTEAQSTLE